MNAEMAFEAVILSRDTGVILPVNSCLQQLSIATDISFSPDGAAKVLKQNCTDLVVLDLETDKSANVLEYIWNWPSRKKPTIVAITGTDSRIPGAHFMLSRPVTQESAKLSFKAVYQHMLRDYRHYARHALMLPTEAIDEVQRRISLTVTDISEGGLGLMTKEDLPIGSTLRMTLPLPSAPRGILIEAVVLWKREYSRLGCEFSYIPILDLAVLRDWLKERASVKKPLIEV